MVLSLPTSHTYLTVTQTYLPQTPTSPWQRPTYLTHLPHRDTDLPTSHTYLTVTQTYLPHTPTSLWLGSADQLTRISYLPHTPTWLWQRPPYLAHVPHRDTDLESPQTDLDQRFSIWFNIKSEALNLPWFIYMWCTALWSREYEGKHRDSDIRRMRVRD